jgi:glycyl-tRNA synthetase beta chain
VTQTVLQTLLLEIGTEEIPARFLSGAIGNLKENASAILHENHIGGNPTEAAVKFANSQGIEVENLIVKKKDKGEYVVAVVREEGLAVKDLLPEVLKSIVHSIRFPKTMRWGDGSMRFARPIHWLLAMFGKDAIRFQLDGLESGNITWGHRFLSPARFQIKNISDFKSLLENSFVIVDQEKRRKIILEGIRKLAASVRGMPMENEELIETVNYLVEYPFPVLCSFHKEYLELPKELLVTVMKDHQKFFAIEDEEGRLVNYFIVISNTKKENEQTVRIGAERVIRARFEDAKFYFEEDRKRTLNERIAGLRKVIFQEKLGSFHEKTERMVSIAEFLSERLMPLLKEKILRACWLSKTDLLTGIIREFTELQGVMGKYYALHDGEDMEIATALEEQYLPKHSGGELPHTEIGALLSIADKIDNVASFFSLGLIPTGSEDPFALRRQALGIIAIILDKGYDIPLKDLIDRALQNLFGLFLLPEKIDERIFQFFEQRFESVFSEKGYDSDLIQSVLFMLLHQPLKDVEGRLDALKRFKEDKGYNTFLLAIKRVYNILPKKEVPAVEAHLLIEEAERNLKERLDSIKPDLLGLLDEKRYDDAINLLTSLTDPVNQFFDHVLVMDKREEIKQNRLALLKEVWKTVSKIADFSRLQAS